MVDAKTLALDLINGDVVSQCLVPGIMKLYGIKSVQPEFADIVQQAGADDIDCAA